MDSLTNDEVQSLVMDSSSCNARGWQWEDRCCGKVSTYIRSMNLSHQLWSIVGDTRLATDSEVVKTSRNPTGRFFH